jgi:hypothetical protein
MNVPTITPNQVLKEVLKYRQSGCKAFTRRTQFPTDDPFLAIEIYETVLDGQVWRRWLAVSRSGSDGCQIIDGPEAERAMSLLLSDADSTQA